MLRRFRDWLARRTPRGPLPSILDLTLHCQYHEHRWAVTVSGDWPGLQFSRGGCGAYDQPLTPLLAEVFREVHQTLQAWERSEFGQQYLGELGFPEKVWAETQDSLRPEGD